VHRSLEDSLRPTPQAVQSPFFSRGRRWPCGAPMLSSGLGVAAQGTAAQGWGSWQVQVEERREVAREREPTQTCERGEGAAVGDARQVLALVRVGARTALEVLRDDAGSLESKQSVVQQSLQNVRNRRTKGGRGSPGGVRGLKQADSPSSPFLPCCSRTVFRGPVAQLATPRESRAGERGIAVPLLLLVRMAGVT